MASLKLSRSVKDRLVAGNHHAPRSLLGFHEATGERGERVWVVRALEPDAMRVLVDWDGEGGDPPVELARIHDGGLFELICPPRPRLVPYDLIVEYADGTRIRKRDAYYFAPQLTDYDLHLFAEGNHHRIYWKLGAHPVEQDGVRGTRFAVWAPNAVRVSVVGAFNLWDGRRHPMQRREPGGVWELFVPGVGPGEAYKYEIKTASGKVLLKADPYGNAMQLRPENCSLVTDLGGFRWTDDAWMAARAAANPRERPVNVYEVHPGSWMRVVEENQRFLTYEELADALIPYALDMGYTHVELIGIAEHPYDASWGYQVTGYYAPTSRFGSPHGFMHFVDRCHAAGLGVIMDWVPGHFPKDAHGLVQFDGTCLYEHADPRQGEHLDWGTKIFNYGRNEVRNFLVANALFWFDQFHVDGLRVDAVASMLLLDYSRPQGEWIPNRYGGRENLEAIEFLRTLNDTVAHYYPGTMMIAEESTAFPGVTHPTKRGGLGFTLKWNMGWMNDTLRYMQTDPVLRKYNSELITFSMVYAYSEAYLLPLSHDEVVHGKGSLLQKMALDDESKRAQLKLYLCFQTAHPGKQLLFMGQEFGQWREWTEAQSIDWHLLQYPWHAQIHAFVKALNHLYRAHPALWDNDYHPSGFLWLEVHDHERSVYAFLRRARSPKTGPPIVFVFNFTPVARDGYVIGVPHAGTYRKLLDSDAPEWGGTGYNRQPEVVAQAQPYAGRRARLVLDLPPFGALVLQRVDGAEEAHDDAGTE
jgi:1,4-alpha-glucan branching enzyme